MKSPCITINGDIKILPPLKARIWREFIHFYNERENISLEDFVDEHAKMIALAFNMSVDEILDNLAVEDILPTFHAVLNYLMAQLSAKITADKKNEEESPLT